MAEKMITVITTINPPNNATKAWRRSLSSHNGALLVVGDRKTPDAKWRRIVDENLRFLSLSEQHARWELGRMISENSYARKNLGYLDAMMALSTNPGACIHETDDDNLPMGSWGKRAQGQIGRLAARRPWVNIYQYFLPRPATVWPRGFPLEEVSESLKVRIAPKRTGERRPVLQQGLADQNPDVDAIHRLLFPKEILFESQSEGIIDGSKDPNTLDAVFLEKGSWCPINSQNTWWWAAAFPLMYLPSHCSMRTCDILRGYIAVWCLQQTGHDIAFFAPDVYQKRNPHNLLEDFQQEVSLYLNAGKFRKILEETRLENDPKENLLRCYHSLAKADIHPHEEKPIVQAWCDTIPAGTI